MKLFPEKPKVEHRCPCGGAVEYVQHTMKHTPFWMCDKCSARFKPAQELVCVQVQYKKGDTVFPLGLKAECFFKGIEDMN